MSNAGFDSPNVGSQAPVGADFAANVEAVRARTEACQKLVDDAVAGKISGPTFLESLRNANATPDEVKDFITQLTQRRKQQHSTSSRINGSQGQTTATTPNQLDAATAVAWAVLRARLDHLQTGTPQSATVPDTALLSDDIADLLGISTTKGSIPASVLAKAPHLSKLSDSTKSDPHLERTQELVTVFSPQSVQDVLVNKAQFAPVSDPLPCTIWHKILIDHFVDFEKLFASMDRGYDHHDDPKDFGAGYALVKKDQAFTKRPLQTEAEWTRVFGAWSAGVVFFFPHRNDELGNYRSIVMDLFRAASSNPRVAISFDVHVRDKYSKKPFRLDDRNQLNFPLLTQMLSSARLTTPLTTPRNSK